MTSWLLHEFLAHVRKIDNFNLMATKQVMLEAEFLKAGLSKFVPEEVVNLLLNRVQNGQDIAQIFGAEEKNILKDAKESTKVQLMCFN